MPVQDPPSHEVTAWHEAGHVVCALASGGRVRLVDMAVSPPSVDSRWYARHTPLDIAAFSLSGYVAEVLCGYDRLAWSVLDWTDLGHDGHEAANMITTHDLDVSDVIHRVAALIAAHCQAVADLARVLARAEFVPGWILAAWWAAQPTPDSAPPGDMLTAPEPASLNARSPRRDVTAGLS